jgi:TRAP-type mannitol/chloroaromatic compound transport system substrate-binding protein
MKRRDFMTKAGVAAGAGVVAASTLSTPALASKKVELNIVSTWGRDFPGLGTGAQRLAKRVQEVSGGEIVTNYFAAGEKVGAFDSFDEVASGNSQAYHAADYYWKGKHPGWAFFTSVPYGLTYTENAAWIHHMGGQQLWDELAGRHLRPKEPANSSQSCWPPM